MGLGIRARFLIPVLLACATTAHTEELNALGFRITYGLPNEHWHVATQDFQSDKGLVLFFHDEHPSADPNALDPSLSILYERLSVKIRTAQQYAEYSQSKSSFPLSDQQKVGNCVLYFHRWEGRVKNNLIRIFEVHGDIGIQFLGTATAERSEEFLPPVLDFIGKSAACGR